MHRVFQEIPCLREPTLTHWVQTNRLEEKGPSPQPLIHTTYPDMVLSPFPRDVTIFIHDLKENKEFEDTMDSLLYNIGWGMNTTPLHQEG